MKAPIVFTDDRIPLERRYRTHVQDCANGGSPVPDRPSAPQATAVPIERRYSDQRRDLPAIESAEFRKFAK